MKHYAQDQQVKINIFGKAEPDWSNGTYIGIGQTEDQTKLHLVKGNVSKKTYLLDDKNVKSITVQKEGWVNLWRRSGDGHITSTSIPHLSEANAIAAAKRSDGSFDHGYAGTAKVEWEEEV